MLLVHQFSNIVLWTLKNLIHILEMKNKAKVLMNYMVLWCVTLETTFSANQAIALVVQEDFVSLCQKIFVTDCFFPPSFY